MVDFLPPHLSEDTEKIYFYDKPSERVREENIYLNNYAPSPMTIKGKNYPTLEHYYHAQKFVENEDNYEYIRTAESADDSRKKAYELAKTALSEESKKKWESSRKLETMRMGIVQKYRQNKDLLDKLLGTGDKVLIEDSDKDLFWGGALAGSKNMLGVLLMEFREREREIIEI